MDPDGGADSQKAVSLQWKSYKLVQDPAIRRVTQKIYRYDGVHFSVPDSGFPPVGELRDPRPRRLWSRYTEMSLPVPKFKLDEFYVGPIPLKEVTFARLNDNIKEPFLADMCAKFGEVEEMEILFHPKTRKHLGLARVLFTSTRGAKDTVKQLHNTSVMGNIIHAQLDIKGQQRQKYYDLMVNGSYTPQTVPLGGKALTERLQPQPPTQPPPPQPQPDTSTEVRRRLSSDLVVLAAGVQALTSGSVTPCSVDTGFSDQRLDTPPSTMAGPFTPGSTASVQSGGGTPYSSRSGTPFSQDSGYAGSRHTGFNTGTLGSGYPPQDMLPSSSSSSAVSSTVGGYKVSRYSEDAQEPSVYHRGRPMYPPATSYRPNEPPCYPPYPNVSGPGPHMAHHSMPPPPLATQYDQPAMSDRDRDRDSGVRYGPGGIGSRRSSYHHQQDTNSSSKYHTHHSHHHSDRRDDRGHRRDSLGSRSGDHSHQRHRNHHHSHNHHGSGSRRRSSHDRDRDRDRDRDGDYSNSSDPRYNSNSYRSSSNSMSPPPSSYPAFSSSKEPAPAPPQGLDVSTRQGCTTLAERGSLPSVGADKDYHAGHHGALPPPPPPPPPLPPASVIAAAVAETLGTMDFSQDSPAREEQWTKPKRRPSTPPAPPKTPPPSSPPHPSITSSTASPSSTSLPHHLPSSSSSPQPPQRDSSSPEPDSTNESLPFAYHSSSLDSRIEMLLKEQKAKFSFLASDEEDEDDKKEDKQRGARGERRGGSGDATGEHTGANQVGDNGNKDQRRKGENDRGKKLGKGGDGRKSPTVLNANTPSSSTYSPHIPPPEEPQAQVGLAGPGASQEESSQAGSADTRSTTGAHTPPYNGQSQSSPHSSGEDMEISDEEEEEGTTITTVTTHQPSITSGSSPSSSQAAMPSQAADPSSSPQPISDSAQHFGTSMHPPMPSYPPHLPPPPPPGYSLQPPPPPGIPPIPHMELHPEYPPPMPHHMYDYATSMELMNQYSGGAPMSFQMQTHMLSRLHQLRLSSSNGTPSPGEAATADYTSYHLHSMPPPHTHHPYMDQEGSVAGAHYDQDHRYMPPHIAYPYSDPHSTQIPPLQHHGIPPPHTGWPPHVLQPHYPSYMPPPDYSTMLPADGDGYTAPGEEIPLLAENPHEATVQMVLATLIQEMKNIMQRDMNRKMVENVAFATFDEWWERKETKAKPFQTMVRGVSALREDEKKEEKVNRPREPLMSLVDWAKSGGVENFALRGALRLPSFKVKRKEPLELEEGDMKRPRPSTPPDEDDEARRMPEADRHGAERDNKRRRKKPRNRKPWELGSEGEETSDGSSTEKEDEEEEQSEKESDDDALSADSDDESLSSSSDGSSSSASSSSSSEDEEEGERADSDGPDTMDESTLDSTTEKEDGRGNHAAAVPKAEIKPGEAKSGKADTTTAPDKRPPSPPYPRPSSPVVLVPPLKKRRKTVSFSTEENDGKVQLPSAALSPSPSQVAGESPLLSPSTTAAQTPSARPSQGIQLLPFASKPGEGNALFVPPSGRTPDSDESKKGPPVSPQTTPVKSPGKRGVGKDSPKSPAPPVMVCRTVQNLPMDHASMCRMAFEEAPPPPPVNKRSRGRPRTPSFSASSCHSLREEDEGEEESEQRLRLREQLGASSLLQLASASTADLSVLADVALKMDPDAGDSEETETSDEAEEQKMEGGLFSPESLALVMNPEGVVVLTEHNYCKPPVLTAAPSTKRTSSKQDSSVLLPADLNAISGVLEAPEEVIGEALPPRGDAGECLSAAVVPFESEDVGQATAAPPLSKKKGKGSEHEKEESKKRRRKDKENLEVHNTKKQEQPGKKQKKRKLEVSDFEEEVDVEELESGELSSTDTEGDDAVEEVRKSERLFLQEAGVASSQHWPKPVPAPELPAVKFDNRSEFEQMTILYDIWNSGLDGEDLTLLKRTYEKLLQDDHSSDWLNDTHWVNHTITNLPNPRRKKKSADGQLRQHVTGCARSEGYYAISRKEKDVYLDLDLPEQVIREVENVDSSGVNRVLSERRSEQRRLLTVIGTTAVMDSDLLKLNQLKFRKKRLRFGRSRIHEWGLFAMEPIAADEMVIEYVGQNIRQMVADNREKRYAQQGIGSSYLFRVDHDTIIDATKCGNLARFINHCCTPNCYAKVITIESQKKIVIYSKQAIAVNEEITYDYKFPLEDNKIPCLCGTENCRGTLN
uniref:SET domain containing 1A, histone lysine methyltransferase n=1 Tax=Scophthalmus maximus TaxID=52904 RepID=A0A8D3A8W1_SCOMX